MEELRFWVLLTATEVEVDQRRGAIQIRWR